MKKLFTFLFVVQAAATSHAQMPTYYKSATVQNASHSFVTQLLKLQQSPTAAKTTLTKERLIASEYNATSFRPSLNIFDSAKYIYSGNNGSTFDLNQMAYDFPKTQFDYDQPMIDGHGYHILKPEIMCDTARGRNFSSPTSPPLSSVTTAAYDAGGMLLTYKNVSTDTDYVPSLSYYNTYDGSGNVTASIYFNTPNGTSWDTMTKRYFTYNGSGQLITDSTYTRNGTTWYLSSKYMYAYDGGGHLVQVRSYSSKGSAASLLYERKYDQTYYPDGKLETSYISEDTGTGFYLQFVDSFGYAAGYDYYNFFRESAYTPVGWGIVSTVTKTINAAGVPDTMHKSALIYFLDTSGVVVGSQNFLFKDIFIYNTHNDPIETDDYIDMGSGYHDNSTQLFYYEPATSIEQPQLSYEVTIYPNPTKDKLFIIPNDEAKHKKLVIQLTNAEGRLLKSMDIIWQDQDIMLPLADLSTGIYYLSVKDDGGSTYKTQKVIKE